MKRLIGIAALTILTGCTVERTIVQEPITTTTATTQAPEPYVAPPTTEHTWIIDEAGFIIAIEAEYGYLENVRQTALSAGYAVCDHLDTGGTSSSVRDLILQASEDLASVEFLSFVTDSAILYLCPWHVASFSLY